ncbi:MAG: hypothetical protein DWH79_08815 [Planctomycetota bacterium]|nr:MAG: hypothetical protein DWH79_08815 [Planctomycetota bacterium]
MTPEEYQSRTLYEQLLPGDRVEVVHGVQIGSSANWSTTTVGKVLRRERRRHGLHFRRNPDDKVFSDVLILSRDDGEMTTVTMDEYTRLRKL